MHSENLLRNNIENFIDVMSNGENRWTTTKMPLQLKTAENEFGS